jgi:PleD family two-component response regulator
MTATLPAPHTTSGIILSLAPQPDSWLGGILATRGHTVIHHVDGPSAVQRAVDEDVDLLIVAADLPGDAALAVCRAMRERSDGDRPVVVESGRTLTDRARLTLMEEGAWECIAQDDPRLDEQLLRVEACLRFRRATARERLGALTDSRTGLYNRLGLSRRARELGAQLFRTHDSLACVVFTMSLEPDTEAAMATCARAVHEEGRDSDILARLGDREIAILAPRTDAEGAVRLAERLARTLRGATYLAGGEGIHVELRAAFDAIAGAGFVAVRPIDLVIRAALSLRERERERETSGPWIRRSGGHSQPTELHS